MSVSTKVIGIRYAYRTKEHENGEGRDGFVILQETNGTRHGIILIHDAIGVEILGLIHEYPGEPLYAHELFVELLRRVGTIIEQITFVDDDSSDHRAGDIVLRSGTDTWTRECSVYDVVGLSIASGVPVTIEEELFASMYEAAPSLEQLMGSDNATVLKSDAERLALADDDSQLGKA